MKILRNSFIGSCAIVALVVVSYAKCGAAVQQTQGKLDGVPGDFRSLNTDIGTQILYELQVRSLNACHLNVGSAEQRTACAERVTKKLSPVVQYRAEGKSCSIFEKDLKPIQLGTLDDMMKPTLDFKEAITLNYVRELGATTLWVMPLFPNNDTWNIPDACDNLGSPYAVRDYMHVQGSLDQECNKQGRDEHSDAPCWGNDKFKKFVAEAHAKGLKVWLDVALNHFGHNYQIYDYVNFIPVSERLEKQEDLGALWIGDQSFDPALVNPEILDSIDKLERAVQTEPNKSLFDEMKSYCGAAMPTGLKSVRAFNAWRNALPFERTSFKCGESYLEAQVPSFYMGKSGKPSKGVGDNLTNNWVDVKFLYHEDDDPTEQHVFIRNREYMFRIMNYYASLGVDGFRLDHTTEDGSGLDANEWRYITNKVDFYSLKRGNKRLSYMAEEFSKQMDMARVVDAMTDGFVGDLAGRKISEKNSSHVEKAVANMDRFNGKIYVLSALETHDEHRLVDHTGFNVWTGAGFWGVGLTTWSLPMVLAGQELGEPWGLGFKRSDFIRSRFEGSNNFRSDSPSIRDFYARMMHARTKFSNRALYSSGRHFLRTKDGNNPDQRIFAQIKWSDDANVVFAFHNLWEQNVEQAYFIPPEVAAKANIDDNRSYRLRNILANDEPQVGGCVSGRDLKWNLFVRMGSAERVQWLRLEECGK
jgi:hypothetical protein